MSNQNNPSICFLPLIWVLHRGSNWGWNTEAFPNQLYQMWYLQGILVCPRSSCQQDMAETPNLGATQEVSSMWSSSGYIVSFEFLTWISSLYYKVNIILERKGQQSDNLLQTATGDGGKKERKKPQTEPGRESILSLSISFPDIYRERRTQGDKAAVNRWGVTKMGWELFSFLLGPQGPNWHWPYSFHVRFILKSLFKFKLENVYTALQYVCLPLC